MMHFIDRTFRKGIQAVVRHAIRSMVTYFCANDPKILSMVRIDVVTKRIENFYADLPLFYFLMLNFNFLILEYATLPLSLKLRPFRYLTYTNQLRYMQSWPASSIALKRMCFTATKYISMTQIYGEPELLKSIGYEKSFTERTSQQCTLTAQS